MKLLKASLLMVMLSCLIGLVGCADDDLVAGDTGSTGSTGDTGPAIMGGGLVGTWLGSCGEAIYSDYYMKPIAEYTATGEAAGDLVYTEVTYEDSSCTSELWEYRLISDFTILNQIENASGQSVTEIDYTSFSSALTMLDDDEFGWNYVQVCGFNDWKRYVPKDITGREECDFPAPAYSDTQKRVIQLNENGAELTDGVQDFEPYGDVREEELTEIIYFFNTQEPAIWYGSRVIQNNVDAEKLIGFTEVTGNLIISGDDSLTSIEPLNSITSVGGGLFIIVVWGFETATHPGSC